MGQPSDDVDLMVDNMSGEAFARIMADEMGLRGPSVIKSNPDKTKKHVIEKLLSRHKGNGGNKIFSKNLQPQRLQRFDGNVVVGIYAYPRRYLQGLLGYLLCG